MTSTHPRPDASDLDPDAYNLWLDSSVKDDGAASELLKPFNARLMRCYLVSKRINHVANDNEECSRPRGACRDSEHAVRVEEQTCGDPLKCYLYLAC